jgi:hypothetical protein
MKSFSEVVPEKKTRRQVRQILTCAILLASLMLTLPPSLKAQQTHTLTTIVASGAGSGSISVAVISNGGT